MADKVAGASSSPAAQRTAPAVDRGQDRKVAGASSSPAAQRAARHIEHMHPAVAAAENEGEAIVGDRDATQIEARADRLLEDALRRFGGQIPDLRAMVGMTRDGEPAPVRRDIPTPGRRHLVEPP